MINNKNLSKKNKEFLSYLEGKDTFPLKGDFFKFLIVSSKVNIDVIENFFMGFLKDMLLFECDNYYLIIYQNKEKLELENFIELFNEDMGIRSSIFEGFYINKKNSAYLMEFLEIYDSLFSTTKMYSNVSDLILLSNNNRKVLDRLKKIVLDKYLSDASFISMVRALFKNNLNVSKAASDLYMHRNTLNNKLNAFERDTALTIQNFVDAVSIYELLK